MDAAQVWSGARRPLAVVAHPDDESFGLGALLSAGTGAGAQAGVLCFTRGEASTLHGVRGDLREVRAHELRAAASVLGLTAVHLGEEADGRLSDRPVGDLAAQVVQVVAGHRADVLLCFDEGGVTGHPDHDAATRAAVAAHDLLAAEGPAPAVIAWALPEAVAAELRRGTGAPFVGRGAHLLSAVPVDRSRQLLAVQEHPSQAVPGSVLWRRLELSGDVEHVRMLRPAVGVEGPRARPVAP